MSLVDETGEWMNKTISLFGAVRSFISQLRVGQDMTKIPMPALFFRPYSLLEVLGSRHLSYIDILYQLETLEDPEERMLAVAAWYISNLRKEMQQFYKKPYNPILGEFHECKVADDPVKATSDQSVFTGEQVSHHPPISAVHVVNAQRQLELLVNYTFSVKFFTNSVGVNTEGNLELYTKRGEVYAAKQGMPDMSITNVIWGTRQIYWVGKVAIVCPQTKLQAVIDFKADTWYTTNPLSGTITSLDAPDKVLASFEGECGGITRVTHGNRPQRVLFDPATFAKRKIVYPPKDQWKPLSSLGLWADTNKAIVADDLDAADAAKKIVEDAQRDRREKNENPPMQFFVFDEATKFYRPKDPLHKPIALSAAALAATNSPAGPATPAGAAAPAAPPSPRTASEAVAAAAQAAAPASPQPAPAAAASSGPVLTAPTDVPAGGDPLSIQEP